MARCKFRRRATGRLEAHRKGKVETVQDRFEFGQRFRVLVIREVGVPEIYLCLVVAPDERHQHSRMEVQFGHAADKGVPKRVEDFAVVDDFPLNDFAAAGQRPSEGTVRTTAALAAATVSGPRAASRIGARRGGNKFASGSFAENCSSDARLRQFCNFPDASRTLPNLNSDESAPA
ncbi:hypothetical protein PQQ63_37640 [Paraburkholderia metrosideri]|uniref:Uncharacterized protein n=1 Tax=Paraburkholderia metrosideri TaxID=580937 RepID=A0ABW9E8I5_9BURK